SPRIESGARALDRPSYHAAHPPWRRRTRRHPSRTASVASIDSCRATYSGAGSCAWCVSNTQSTTASRHSVTVRLRFAAISVTVRHADRPPIRTADDAPVAVVHGGGGADRRAHDRGEYHDLQHRQCRDPPAAAVCESEPDHPDRREEREGWHTSL